MDDFQFRLPLYWTAFLRFNMSYSKKKIEVVEKWAMKHSAIYRSTVHWLEMEMSNEQLRDVLESTVCTTDPVQLVGRFMTCSLLSANPVRASVSLKTHDRRCCLDDQGRGSNPSRRAY